MCEVKDDKGGTEVKMDKKTGVNPIITLSKKTTFGIFIGGIVCIIIILVLGVIYKDSAPVFNLILLASLIIVTMFYVYYTMKMADEMRKQRGMTSMPLLIMKSVHNKDIWEGNTKDCFSHFEISNVGNTPAIEVESSITVNKSDYLQSIRQTYLRKDDPPIKFRPYGIENLEEDRTYYLICEYQNILSYGVQKPFYSIRHAYLLKSENLVRKAKYT